MSESIFISPLFYLPVYFLVSLTVFCCVISRYYGLARTVFIMFALLTRWCLCTPDIVVSSLDKQFSLTLCIFFCACPSQWRLLSACIHVLIYWYLLCVYFLSGIVLLLSESMLRIIHFRTIRIVHLDLCVSVVSLIWLVWCYNSWLVELDC